jgi:hypothetical protein
MAYGPVGLTAVVQLVDLVEVRHRVATHQDLLVVASQAAISASVRRRKNLGLASGPVKHLRARAWLQAP